MTDAHPKAGEGARATRAFKLVVERSPLHSQPPKLVVGWRIVGNPETGDKNELRGH